jgi:hypothetical protein
VFLSVVAFPFSSETCRMPHGLMIRDQVISDRASRVANVSRADSMSTTQVCIRGQSFPDYSSEAADLPALHQIKYHVTASSLLRLLGGHRVSGTASFPFPLCCNASSDQLNIRLLYLGIYTRDWASLRVSCLPLLRPMPVLRHTAYSAAAVRRRNIRR